MTISIEINPEVQAELGRQAAARGMDVPSYAAVLLEEAAHLPPAGRQRLDHDRLQKTLDEMAQFSNKIPSLPDAAFSRESLYKDHD